MPQLVTAPWFFIFLTFWVVFITLTPYKILFHQLPISPSTITPDTKLQTWAWTWH